MAQVGNDILGNIAILKFDLKTLKREKIKIANRFLKQNKSVTTVLEKTGKFSGRMRKQSTKYLVGDKTKEILYKENNCIFRLNIDSCYFSPRLSEERKEIANKVKRNESVLVMFGGVGAYAIIISKIGNPKRIVSVEISKECNKYAKINVKRNKMQEKVEIVQGDVKRKLPKII